MNLQLAGLLTIAGTSLTLFLTNHFDQPDRDVSYESWRLDPQRLVIDRLLHRAGDHAQTWKVDAAWWSLELRHVRRDGTIDVIAGGHASVRFVSPSRVQALTSKRRRDALKRYDFGAEHISHRKLIGVRSRWQSIYLPPKPACDVRQLVARLRVPADATVDISFDPKHAYGPGAPQELSYRVRSRHREIDGWYSTLDCRRTYAGTR